MEIIGFNQLDAMLAKRGGLELSDLKNFGSSIDNIIDEFIERRYVKDEGDLLFNLNNIVNKLKSNIPIYLYGEIKDRNGNIIENAKVDIKNADILFNGSNCDVSTSKI